MEHHIMSDEYVFSDNRWKSVRQPRHWPITMDDTAVLNIASCADNNSINLGTDDTIIPDTCLWSDGDISDYSTPRGDKGAVVNARRFTPNRDDADIASINH